MSFYITFLTSSKPMIIDNVKSFVMLTSFIMVKYEDGSQSSLYDVMGIMPHFYHEG